MGEENDWRDTFCGRQQELLQLVDKFVKVAAGNGPHLAVVLGDRGMGKTRLVQELYRTLAIQHDPLNYWPDASLFHSNNLRVTPDLIDPRVRAHFESFKVADRPMPYLWWGFRLSDPDIRNAARSDMAAHRVTLDMHLGPVQFARQIRAARAKLKEAGVDAASELGKSLLKELVKAIPGIGVAASVVDVFIDYAEKGKAATQAIREEQRLRGLHREMSLIRMDADRADDIHKRTLDDLAAVLAPNNVLASLPCVVFCDDAQFARKGGDEGALFFLTSLWQRAQIAEWPLFLILTHWGHEWHSAAALSMGTNCATELRRDASSAQYGLLIDLPKEPALAEIARAGVPELTNDDVALLLSKADGNPQILIELIGLVRRSPAWRQGRNGALTTHARNDIESRSTSLTTLILERLQSDSTPQAVRQAVALSSVQGMEFVCTLTETVARSLQIGSVADGLSVAQHPYRLIAGVEEGVAEFVQRAYREASASLLGSHVGDPKMVERALINVTIDLVDDPDRWAGLTLQQQTATWEVLAGLAQNHEDAAVRRYAGKALLKLVTAIVGAEGGPDYARAAAIARRFDEGIGRYWVAKDFDVVEMQAAADAILTWFGPDNAAHLVAEHLAQARALAATLGTPEALNDLNRSLAAAGVIAREQGNWPDAGNFYLEGLEISRRQDHAGRVGGMILCLGELAQAQSNLPEADRLYRTALKIFRAIAHMEDTPTAKILLSFALDKVSEVAWITENWPEARAFHSESLELKRAVPQNTPTVRREMLASLDFLGRVAMQQGDLDEAYRLFSENLAIARELAAKLDIPNARRDVLAALHRLGTVARARSNFQEAETLYRESLAISRELLAVLGSHGAQRDVAASLSVVGTIALVKGDCSAAEQLYRESLEIRRRLSTALSTPDAQLDVAEALDRMGEAAQAAGNWSAADQSYREGVEITRGLVGTLGGTQVQFFLAGLLINTGYAAQQRGDWLEANRLYCEALDIGRKLVEHRATPDARTGLAASLTRVSHAATARGNFLEAARLGRESMNIYRELDTELGTSTSGRNVAAALYNIGILAENQGNLSEAKKFYYESLGIYRGLAVECGTPEAQSHVASMLNSVGNIAKAQGDLGEASALYREGLDIQRRLAAELRTPEAQCDVATALQSIGDLARALKDQDQAEKAYSESLAISRELADTHATAEVLRNFAAALSNVGCIAEERGDVLEAERLYRESIALFRGMVRKVGTLSAKRNLGFAIYRLAVLLRLRGDTSASCECLRETALILDEVAVARKTPEALNDAEVLRNELDEFGCSA
jgi:tetratricopeptide (TPR) repeat protein